MWFTMGRIPKNITFNKQIQDERESCLLGLVEKQAVSLEGPRHDLQWSIFTKLDGNRNGVSGRKSQRAGEPRKGNQPEGSLGVSKIGVPQNG